MKLGSVGIKERQGIVDKTVLLPFFMIIQINRASEYAFVYIISSEMRVANSFGSLIETPPIRHASA